MKQIIFTLISLLLINNVIGDNYYAKRSGNWNSTSTWEDASGNAVNSTPSTSDDVIIDGYKVTVGSNEECSSIIVKSDNKNADTYLKINSSYTLNVSNDITLEMPNNTSYYVQLMIYDCTLNIGGDLIFNRGNSNNTDEYLRLYNDGATINISGDFIYNYHKGKQTDDSHEEIDLRDDAILNCTNFTVQQDNGGTFLLQMYNTAKLNVSNIFSIDHDGGLDLHIETNNDAQININNNFNIDWDGSNDDGSDIFIDLKNTSVFNIDGSVDIDMNETSNDDCNLYFYANSDVTAEIDGDFTLIIEDGNLLDFSLDRNANFTVHGNLNLYQAGDAMLYIHLNKKNDGNSTDAQVQIDGNVTIQKTDGAGLEFFCDYDSDFNVTGDLNISASGFNDNSRAEIRLEHDAKIDVDGSLNFEMDVTTQNSLFLDMDSNSKFYVGKNDGNYSESAVFNIKDGHEFCIEMDREAQFICYGDITLTQNGRDHMNIKLNTNVNGNVIFEAKRNCNININTEDWKHLTANLNSNAQFKVGNNLTITNNSSDITYSQCSLDRDAKIIVGGNLTLNHNSKGSISIIANSNNDGSTTDGQINVGGDLSISGGSVREFEINLDYDSDINVTGNFNIDITGYDVTWGGLEINLAHDAGISVNDDFYISNKGSGADINTNINMENNTFINVGTSDTTSDFEIIHNALDEFKIEMQNSTHINVYGDFTIDKKNNSSSDNALVYLNDDAYIFVNKHLILKNSNNSNLVEIDLHDDSSILNVRGNIDMTSASDEDRIKIYAEYASNIYIGGSFLRNDKPNKYGILNCDDEATVHYDGDGTYGQQTIAENYGDGTDNFTYQYVIINNSWNSIPQLTMEGVTEILGNRNLTFSDGIVESSSSNYFKILDNATVSDASDSSYIDGYIHKIGDDAFTFPVGDTDDGKPDSTGDEETRYAPLVISAPSSTSTDFYCVYKNENPAIFGTDKEETLDHISKEEYWLLEPTSGSPTVNVTLSWYQARSGDIDNTSALRIAHWDGSIWNDYGNDGTTGDNTEGTIVVNNVSNFSPFTLASVSDENPLPIYLMNFNATTDKHTVYLKWTTASEVNNNYFIIEKSKDAIHFEKLKTIKGLGNSSKTHHYKIIDKTPYDGISYYRLKHVDFDENTFYSNIKIVNLSDNQENNQINFQVFPNPATSLSKITISGFIKNTNLKIIDITGKLVFSKKINSNKIYLNTDILSKGIYFLSIYNKTEIINKKIIIN